MQYLIYYYLLHSYIITYKQQSVLIYDAQKSAYRISSLFYKICSILE